MVVPNNHGFPTKNDHFGVFWGHPTLIWFSSPKKACAWASLDIGLHTGILKKLLHPKIDTPQKETRLSIDWIKLVINCDDITI